MREKRVSPLSGRTLSDEHKKKIGLANAKFKRTPEQRARTSAATKAAMQNPELRRRLSDAKRGMVSTFKGKKHSDEARARLSASHIGKPSSRGMLGKRHSSEVRARQSLSHRGEKHYNWQGGKTEINRTIRRSLEYREWRKLVFERDNYVCVECGEVGGRLHADHIKPFSQFVELRFIVSNGRTLCVPCHKKTPTWGAKSRRSILNVKGD